MLYYIVIIHNSIRSMDTIISLSSYRSEEVKHWFSIHSRYDLARLPTIRVICFSHTNRVVLGHYQTVINFKFDLCDAHGRLTQRTIYDLSRKNCDLCANCFYYELNADSDDWIIDYKRKMEWNTIRFYVLLRIIITQS